MKEKFNNLTLVSGDIVYFNAFEVGQRGYLREGATDWAQLPAGKYCSIDNTYFTLDDNGVITNISGNPSTLKTINSPVNQGFKKSEQMAKLNLDDINNSGTAGAGENNGTPRAIDKSSTKGKGSIDLNDDSAVSLKRLERLKRQAEIDGKTKWNSTGDKAMMNPKDQAVAYAKFEKEKHAKEAAEAAAERYYIDFGEWPSEKQVAKFAADHEDAVKVVEKQESDLDKRFRKARAIFSMNSTKQFEADEAKAAEEIKAKEPAKNYDLLPREDLTIKPLEMHKETFSMRNSISLPKQVTEFMGKLSGEKHFEFTRDNNIIVENSGNKYYFDAQGEEI